MASGRCGISNPGSAWILGFGIAKRLFPVSTKPECDGQQPEWQDDLCGTNNPDHGASNRQVLKRQRDHYWRE